MNNDNHPATLPASQARRFYDCTLNEKLLYSAFLLMMGIAYLMALTYLYTSYDGIDGKPGLSVEDVASNYYGNRSGTRLESALRGSMAAYIDTEQRHHVIAWLQSGAPQADYQSIIQPIFSDRCVMCHSGNSSLQIPDLSHYEGVMTTADIDTGVSLHSLMKVSHIHLFGVALVALGIGLVFRFALLPAWFQHSLTLTPFIAIFIDIAAWFFTKWDPVYAYIVIIAGAFLGLSWALQICISLYQIWFLRRQTSSESQDSN